MENTLQELRRENIISPPGERSDLTKLAFSLVGLFFAYWLFSRFEGLFVYRHGIQSGGGALDWYLRLGEELYPPRALFILIEMLVVIWLFRPVSQLLGQTANLVGTVKLAYDVGLGIAGGLAGFLVTIPFVGGVATSPFLSNLVNPDHRVAISRILEIFLFGLLLPVGTELIFRGIVQRTLKAHMSASAAILVSAVLGACLWSIFNFPFALALGLLCGALFSWRGALLPALVADIVMTVSAGVYVALRI